MILEVCSASVKWRDAAGTWTHPSLTARQPSRWCLDCGQKSIDWNCGVHRAIRPFPQPPMKLRKTSIRRPSTRESNRWRHAKHGACVHMRLFGISGKSNAPHIMSKCVTKEDFHGIRHRRCAASLPCGQKRPVWQNRGSGESLSVLRAVTILGTGCGRGLS